MEYYVLQDVLTNKTYCIRIASVWTGKAAYLAHRSENLQLAMPRLPFPWLLKVLKDPRH